MKGRDSAYGRTLKRIDRAAAVWAAGRMAIGGEDVAPKVPYRGRLLMAAAHDRRERGGKPLRRVKHTTFGHFLTRFVAGPLSRLP